MNNITRSKKIKKFLIDSDISQYDLSQMLNTTPANISRVINFKRTTGKETLRIRQGISQIALSLYKVINWGE